jgi:hypothetical protein
MAASRRRSGAWEPTRKVGSVLDERWAASVPRWGRNRYAGDQGHGEENTAGPVVRFSDGETRQSTPPH